MKHVFFGKSDRPCKVVLGKKGFIPLTARSYVQDGLVAMWDGIENAGWGVHDPNATTWKNLIPDSPYPDFDIKSGGTWGAGCLLFNGLAAQSKTAWPTFDNIDLVYRLNSGYVDFAPNIQSRMRWFQSNPTIGAVFSGTGNNRKAYQYSEFSFGNAISLSMQYGTSDINSLYVNGSLRSQTSTRTQTTAAPSVTCIGQRIGVQSQYNTGTGSIWRIAIYSRVLTTNEIAANYAVDKARFNLP